MKILGIILLVLGIVCLGYNYFVLQPVLATDLGRYTNARELSDITGLAGTILLAFGGLFSFLSYRKTKSMSQMIMAIVGVVLAIVCFMVAFGRVV